MANEFDTPQSRNEALLQNLLGEENEVLDPMSNIEKILLNILGYEGLEIDPIQSRNEALLLQILEQGTGGGGGGVTVEPLSVTENGTYQEEGKAYSPVNVNVPSTGWNPNDFADGTVPSGDIVLNTVTGIAKNAFYGKTGITGISAPLCRSIGENAFYGCNSITSFYLPSVTTLGVRAFFDCKAITVIALPSLTGETMGASFQNCILLETADLGATFNVSNNTFNNAPKLRTLVLRKTDALTSLGQWSSGCLGGIYSNPSLSTIYVPEALVSSYQTASNWSSAYAAGVTFAKIEGTYYETHYADGTPIE